MRIAVGSDELGVDLKNKIIEYLTNKGHVIEDFTVIDSSVDYPDVAYEVAKNISEGKFDRGILVCGTGIGMAISANKVKGVYAAVCHDLYSTQRSILSNNAQIACFGALVVGPSTALALLDVWLNLEFVEGRSSKKIAKIKKIESGQLYTTSHKS